jgi:RNA polymerase sigma-70 factor (ECF subfamily)
VALDVAHAYERFGPMVRRRCQQLLRDPEDARDAMHDVFVRVARRREELDDRALGGLLYRIATGICLNRIRDHKRHPTVPDDDLIARIANADDPEQTASVRTFLDRIFGREPESTRTIAVLHLIDGYTLAEVAEEVGLSVSGVRYRLRALKAQVAELEETLHD